MSAEALVDPELFAALLAEEGVDDAVGTETPEGAPLEEEEEVAVDEKGKYVGRLYPPRKPVTRPSPTAGRAPASSGRSPAGGGSGVPSYLRPTAASAAHHTPAPTAGGGHSASGGRPPSPAASTGSGGASRTPRPGSSASGGGAGAHKQGHVSDLPTICGKTPFSSLPENAGRAQFIAEAEACITAAVGAGAVAMDDVVGLEDAKRALEEAITFPRVMAQLGTPVPAPKGVLLYGPPGTGKTQLARAQATSSGCAFFAVSSSSIMSKWLGDSEKLVKALFDAARYYAPSVVFIDEVDALTGERGGGGEHEAMLRVKNELLAQLDGMASGSPDPDKMVLVLGATNRPWALDEAFRRRFEKRVLIPLPDLPMRRTLFVKSTKASAVEGDVDWDDLARRTEGYNCADIVTICRDAAVGPLRELSARMKAEGVPVSQMLTYVQTHGIRPAAIGKRHFDDALRRIRSSVGSLETSNKLRQWAEEFGSV